jgi:hypothetical protein
MESAAKPGTGKHEGLWIDLVKYVDPTLRDECHVFFLPPELYLDII